MAGGSGFSISIRAVDQTAGPLDGINKRLARLSAPAERFNKALAKFGDVSGVNRITEGFGSLNRTAHDAFMSMDRTSGALAGITSAGSFAGIVALTRSWSDLGNTIGKTAYRLNMPVEKLGVIQGALRLAGGSAAEADAGLQGFNDKLRRATYQGEDVALFDSLHIGFKDAAGNARMAEDALGDVADAIQKLSDSRTQADALGHLGLGAGFLPLFKNGRKGLEDFERQAENTGSAMTKSMVDHATEMNTAWQKFEMDFVGIGNRIVESWSGTVTNVLKKSSDWIEANPKLVDSLSEVGVAVAAIKPSAMLLKLLGLKAIAPATSLMLPTILSGDTPGGDDMGREAARQAGGKTWEDWQAAHPNPAVWLWRWLTDSQGGSAGPSSSSRMNFLSGPSQAGPIGVPKTPSQAAATMQRVHDRLRAGGLTEQETAGVLSNVSAESGFDATKWGDNGTSYGLFQHHAERLRAMQAKYGTLTPNADQQVDFTLDELRTSKRHVWNAMNATPNDAGQSAYVFANGFEVPWGGNAEAARRGQAAAQFVQAAQPPGPTTAQSVQAAQPPGPTAAPSVQAAQPVGQAAVPFVPPVYQGRAVPVTDAAPVNGNVHVEVTLKGAQPGTTAKVTSSGSVTAPPPKIEMPMPWVH